MRLHIVLFSFDSGYLLYSLLGRKGVYLVLNSPTLDSPLPTSPTTFKHLPTRYPQACVFDVVKAGYVMPSLRPRPSEIAVEAKRTYIPYVEKTCPAWPARSFAYSDVENQCNHDTGDHNSGRPRVAVIDGDAVDIALKWNQEETRTKPQDAKRAIASEHLRIPLVLPIDEKRAGGDWESGSMAPEENLSRRSNLVHCLSRSKTPSNDSTAYPVPSKGGIYSPNVG